MIDLRGLLSNVTNDFARNTREGERYRVFTNAFDLEVAADNIPAVLDSASPDLAKWRDVDGSGWMEAQTRAQGYAEAQETPDAAVRGIVENAGADFAVTFLVDQSGSMKGAPMAATAAALTTLEAALAAAGVLTEVLGFSTVGWHGGLARKAWLRAGRPRRPGRLCALLHIVYKSRAENRWSESSRRAMLHPDILRENVDGEALTWAASRLILTERPRKLLMILSDGAPVDDATLLENGATYLERDLRRVIGEIESTGQLSLGALGIGCAIDRYYRVARRAELETILPELIALFGDLVEQSAMVRSLK